MVQACHKSRLQYIKEHNKQYCRRGFTWQEKTVLLKTGKFQCYIPNEATVVTLGTQHGVVITAVLCGVVERTWPLFRRLRRRRQLSMSLSLHFLVVCFVAVRHRKDDETPKQNS